MSNFSIFSERKAAEAAAFLLLKGGGGLELLKLMKLMYLAKQRVFQKVWRIYNGRCVCFYAAWPRFVGYV